VKNTVENFFCNCRIKTPLTVQGYISTPGVDGAMNDKSLRKKYLDRAEKGVERLIYNRTTT
jgi:two-component system phosphate regulon sensor histidine kinase PhoR